MSSKAVSRTTEYGTKCTCQNEECGARFYDHNRQPIFCPICNTSTRSCRPQPSGQSNDLRNHMLMRWIMLRRTPLPTATLAPKWNPKRSLLLARMALL